MTTFFVAMNPPTVTAQEHKVTVVHGIPRIYDTPEIKDARDKLAAYLSKHTPDRPYTGAVRLLTKWCFPLSGSHRDGDWRTSKPDTDNLQKLLKDCMTKEGYWIDDSRVCLEVVKKQWSAIPGIYIEIKRIGVDDIDDG